MKSIKEFSESLRGGVSKANLMDVKFYPCSKMMEKSPWREGLEFLTFKCESADLPGKTFETQKTKEYVIERQTPLGVSFSDLNLNFICSTSMIERRFFDEWMEICLGTQTKRASYYKDIISPKIEVTLYAGQSNIKSCLFKFINTFPLSISSQAVGWEKNEVLRMTVNFSYEKWEVEYFEISK